MDISNIISGIIAIAGISGTILGILGKDKYRKIIEAVILGIEDASKVSGKNIKSTVKTRAEKMGIGEKLHKEVRRITK